jgi:protoporphyrinogen oxidase
MRIAILGGGIAGVAAGFELDAANVDFVVFESNNAIGGLCKTIALDGFEFDIAGVHVLHSKIPAVLDRIRDLLEPNLARSERVAAIRGIDSHLLFPLASHLWTLPIRTRISALASLATARACGAVFRREFRTFKEWVDHEFGKVLADLHYLPYGRKLWKTDPENLSIEWLTSIIPPPKIRSSFRLTTDRKQHWMYHPIRGGIQALVDRLAEGIVSKIRMGAAVAHIERRKGLFYVNGERFDGIVSTLPLPALVALCPQLHSRVVRAADQLRFLSLMTFCIAIDGPPQFHESWVYVPSLADTPVHRISCMGNLGATNVEPGCTSLVAEATYHQSNRIPLTTTFIRSVVDSLARLNLFHTESIRFVEPYTFTHAYVLGDHQYEDARQTVVGGINDFGIHLLGRFGEHRQRNIDYILASSRTLVRQLTSAGPLFSHRTV